MPFYYYKCSKCEETFEKFHNMSETLVQCNICNEPTLEKLPNTNISVGKVSKTGNVVKEFIESAKEELKENKERLLEQELKK